VEDLSAHPLQLAEALDLLKLQEEPSAVRADRSVDHLPGVAAFLAQTVTEEAVHSGTVVVVAREASPVAASLAVPMVVDLGAPTEEVAAFQAVMVAVAAVDNYWAGIAPLRKSNQINQEEDPPVLFFLSLGDKKFRPVV
jgi:hypothetical protein